MREWRPLNEAYSLAFTATMEGSEKAFKDRQNKYGYYEPNLGQAVAHAGHSCHVGRWKDGD